MALSNLLTAWTDRMGAPSFKLHAVEGVAVLRLMGLMRSQQTCVLILARQHDSDDTLSDRWVGRVGRMLCHGAVVVDPWSGQATNRGLLPDHPGDQQEFCS